MAYRVGICDDEQAQIEYMVFLVSAWSRQSGHSCEIRTFASAEAFLFAYEEDKAFDILLLDIEMRTISGIDLAKQIRRDNNRAEIIFITSHFEFVCEGYEVDALHYLVKPIPEDKLFSVLSKAAGRLSVEPPSVILTCDGETIRLYETQILYVEAFRHYLSIHTRDRVYQIKENISSFEQRLSSAFFRTHRSYLVSLKSITRISRTSVCLGDALELPLARGKYDAIHRAFIENN